VRAVNLIPPEERTGATAPTASRSGIVGYAIIGALLVAIGLVFYLTQLGTKIDEHKSEIASLESRVQESQSRAAALQPYVQLANVRAARTVTIDSLAKSRFNWERVLRELAHVTPSTISLSNVTGTVSPDAGAEGGADVSLRDQVPGPALEIEGCARTQRDVADFVASLHDIDGVTRVAAQDSNKGDRPSKSDTASATSGAAATTSDSAAPSGSGGECATNSDANFSIVAAFDPVDTPVEPALDSTGATPVAAATGTEDGGVSAEQASQAQQQAAISNASQRSKNATGLVPGG
jgi:Tfp pilus assembly protein PilN